MDKLNKIITSVFQWITYSSVNPQALSLTLKAGVTFLVLFGVEKETGDMLTEGVTGIVMNVAQIITFAGMVWGATRKIGMGVKTVFKGY
jgi:hypothetical protein